MTFKTSLKFAGKQLKYGFREAMKKEWKYTQFQMSPRYKVDDKTAMREFKTKAEALEFVNAIRRKGHHYKVMDEYIWFYGGVCDKPQMVTSVYYATKPDTNLRLEPELKGSRRAYTYSKKPLCVGIRPHYPNTPLTKIGL